MIDRNTEPPELKFIKMFITEINNVSHNLYQKFSMQTNLNDKNLDEPQEQYDNNLELQLDNQNDGYIDGWRILKMKI